MLLSFVLIDATHGGHSADGLWDDYISSLIIEQKPEGARYERRHRCGKYQLRIVPADPDLRKFLKW